MKNSAIDYDFLFNIHPELAMVVAMFTEQKYDALPFTTLDLIDYGNRLGWAFLENAEQRNDFLRKLAATCLWLLIEQDS